jgi:phosphate-selective porin OprO/OprP
VFVAFNQDARRRGICSGGVSDDQAWNWQYGVFNQRLVQDEGHYDSDHYQAELAGRLANTIWYDECSGGRGYAHWGVSGAVADPDGSNNGAAPPPNPWGRADNEAQFSTRPEARSVERWLDTGAILGADQYELLGLESVLNVGPVQIVGELQNVWLQRNGGGDPHFHGAYVYVSYFLTGEHIPWDRESGQLDRVVPYENFFLVDRCDGGVGGGCGAWQVALRLSYLDLTDHDILGGIGESVTLGLNWYWNPYARLQFNYSYGQIYDHEPVAGQTFGDYHIVGTRLNIDF